VIRADGKLISGKNLLINFDMNGNGVVVFCCLSWTARNMMFRKKGEGLLLCRELLLLVQSSIISVKLSSSEQL
jgi:hypothetical protein